jgi:hypothetical protein
MPTVRAIGVAALLAGVLLDCSGSQPNPGLILTVVNTSRAEATFEWHDDALFARTSSEPIASCRFTTRGLPLGVRTTVSIHNSADQVAFSVEPTVPVPPGTLPTRTVVIHADGTIDADASPVPLPSSSDESVC